MSLNLTTIYEFKIIEFPINIYKAKQCQEKERVYDPLPCKLLFF